MIPIKKLRHVSDIIVEDYMSWSSGDIILIDTQTGSGKTHFVLNTLLPYVAGLGKHILYLSNRSALREQVDLAYNKEYDPFILSETYQKFVHTSKLKKAEYDFLNAEYIVMDEAHYFLDDTQFNGDIHSCLEKIEKGKNHHINIFMTATSTYLLLALNSLSFWEPKICFPEIPYLQEMKLNKYEGLKEPNIICSFLLQYKELSTPRYKSFRESIKHFKDEEVYEDPAWRFSQFKAFYQSNYGEYSSYFSSVFSQYNARIEDAIKQIHFYNGEKDYSYVSPLYYHDDSELVQKIIESPEDEQWLIFTSSINAGHKLHVQCLESGVSDVVFITSKSKNSSSSKDGAALTHIIKYSCFRNKVLITTKVMDNGINLIDPVDAFKTMPSPEDCKYKYLKHIVISEVETTQFLQMLGRKRVHDNSRPINLYLRARKLSSIVAYINRSILPIVKFVSSFIWLKHSRYWNDDENVVSYRARDFQNAYKFVGDYTINGSFPPPYSYYLLLNNNTSYEMPEKARGNSYILTDIFQLNRLVLKKLEYTYYHLMSFVESAYNLKDENPLDFSNIEDSLWIKEQLSWIGLEYNSDCWIPGSQVSAIAQHSAKQRFEELLQLHCRDERIRATMSEVQENEFKQAFLDFISTNYPKSVYAKRKASLQAINNILCELEYPFKVSSEKRSMNGKQRNYWFVEEGRWE